MHPNPTALRAMLKNIIDHFQRSNLKFDLSHFPLSFDDALQMLIWLILLKCFGLEQIEF